MTLRDSGAVLILSLILAGCASTWREDSTAVTLQCPSNEIVVSDRTSGTLTNTWTAQCRGKVYQCSVPAGADAFAPPRCELTGVAPVAAAPSPAVAAPAATSEPAPPLPTSELESKLQILKRAHEQKLITDAEYEAKRRALLDAF